MYAAETIEPFFQDILENDDVKLDSMFIASLVHDLIKVSPAFGQGIMHEGMALRIVFLVCAGAGFPA
jgi:hypothetical protein